MVKTACKSVFIFLLFSLTLFSQTEPTIEENIFQSSKNLHQWGTISSFNGLPSEKVNSITQTSDGMLWFATDNGLARFDGRRVQTNLSVGISSLPVLSLKTDSDDTLWIGTEKGAFYYEQGSFEPIEETADFAINSIFIDGEIVYLADSSGTIFQITKRNKSIESEVLLQSSLPIRSITKINNELYIGTSDSGLAVIKNGEAQQINTVPRPFFINTIETNALGKVLLGATSSNKSSGLFLVEGLPNLKVIGEDLGTINSITFDKNNEVWIGTDLRGAYLFEEEKFRRRFTFENTSGGLRSNKILATYVDREGVIWFGTDKGVSRYNPASPTNERLSDDKETNFIRTLYQSRNGVTYAGTNRGLYEFDEKAKSWKPYRAFKKNTIYSISENSEGKLLVGSRSNLSRIENRISEEIVEGENIRAIEEFRGEIHFSSYLVGVKTLNNSNLITKSNVISLHNETDKYLWLGTIDEGVFIYDGNKIISRPELEELKATTIREITGNETDGIWFATDKGLYLFKDGELQIILANQNSRDVFIKRDADGDLRVWCATENGLFNFVFNEYFGWISSRIDIEQGLSSQNTFAILPIDKNSIWVGTNRGVIRYTISEMRPLLMTNRILSQRIHQPSELKSGINLDYPQNSLSLDVSAISSRTFPEQFQYSFLLFDSKNELIDNKFSEDSQFLMDKLDPDTYRVEVRAYDKNLLSSEPLVFNFTVEQSPFPWIATVLGVLLLITFAALIWAVISQRKIFETSEELVHANKELNNARLNLANEAERERHRISRDLHDQTLADLRHLILMTDEVPSEKSAEFREEIESVSNEIRRICEDLSPSVLENIGFAAALQWALANSVEQVSKENKIEHNFIASDTLEDEISLTSPEQIQIYRITQEVLSNIVRHSGATEIEMTAEASEENGFILKIKDNGKTFDPEKSKKGRGLSNINARAKLIEAKVNWQEADELGMLFTLTKYWQRRKHY